jgi:hypothetical protein
VEHRLGADVGQHGRRLVQGDRGEGGPGGDGIGVPGGQVVEHRDLVATGEQGRRHYAADVAGSTGDEYAHGGHPKRAAAGR